MIGAAALAALSLLATGCGSETALTPAQTLASVKGKVSANQSVRMTMVATAEKEPGTMRSEIVARLGDNPAMSMTMDMPEEAVEPGESTRMEMRLLDNVMYMNMGEDFPGAEPGKPWLRMDLKALGEAGGQDLTGLMDKSLGAQDPSAQIALLQRAGDLREVGKETVNGVKATRYSGTVDLTKLAELTAESLELTDDQLKDFREMVQEEGAPTTTVVDVWIGKDKLPTRMTMRFQDPEAGTITMTCDYTGWGEPVDVVAPPAAQTADAGDFFREMAEEAEAA